MLALVSREQRFCVLYWFHSVFVFSNNIIECLQRRGSGSDSKIPCSRRLTGERQSVSEEIEEETENKPKRPWDARTKREEYKTLCLYVEQAPLSRTTNSKCCIVTPYHITDTCCLISGQSRVPSKDYARLAFSLIRRRMWFSHHCSLLVLVSRMLGDWRSRKRETSPAPEACRY